VDGDGFVLAVDCDDTDPDINPLADEVWYDGLDQDCDGNDDDQDGDGVAVDLDCDDTEPEAAPGLVEICDSIDNDCDDRVDEGVDTWWPDEDGDGFGDDAAGSTTTCVPEEGAVARGGDCDDLEPSANPDQEELCNDGVDNDCNGSPGNCGRAGIVELETEPVLRTGIAAGDLTGYAMAVADLTADGFDDLVIGAPGLARSGSGSGGTFLFAGPLFGAGSLDDADWRLEGVSGELTGRSIGVLSDALTSLLVVVVREPSRALVFEGPLDGAGSEQDAVAIIEPAPDYARSAGDVNSDGWVDLLLSGPSFAPTADPEVTGAVLIFEQPLPSRGSVLDARAVFVAQDSAEEFGAASVTGDFNGDGLLDLFVGAPSAEGMGRVYLFEDALVDAVAEDADAVWDGTQFGSSLGYALATGDLDEDGREELIVGAPLQDDDVSDGGLVIVVPGTTWPDDLTMVSSGIRLLGDREEAFFGLSVEVVENFDGSHRPSLALGAPGYSSDSASYCGAVAVFIGMPEGSAGLSDADLLGVGSAYGTSAGLALASGRLNDDDLDDVAVGLPAVLSPSDAGSVVLFAGAGF
jgi:hypothetical protein